MPELSGHRFQILPQYPEFSFLVIGLRLVSPPLEPAFRSYRAEARFSGMSRGGD